MDGRYLLDTNIVIGLLNGETGHARSGPIPLGFDLRGIKKDLGA